MNTYTPCKVYRKCGGCQLQNMDYPRQLQWKQSRCEKLLGKLGSVSPIIGMNNPYHYRNKVQAAFQTDRSGRVISGVYQSATGRVVATKECQTEDRQAQKIIRTICKLMQSFKLTVFDSVTGRGFLRHVLIRRGFQTGQIMVVLVTGTPVFTAKKHFTAALLQAHPEITTVLQNINNSRLPMVLGTQEKILYGAGYIEDILCGCRFRISARSFYQINPAQTEVLYGKAMEFAGLTSKDKVLDAYCGIGTIGIVAARAAGRVTGVEVNREAVRDAIFNVKQNHLKNTWFQVADAGEFMTEIAKAHEGVDIVFMDPPRAGADTAFLNALLKLSPKRVIYISCNPETLARDLKRLCAGGYRVKAIQPVDMFPFTNHVETVVMLSQQKPDDTIEIDLDLDELDITSSESKATYGEIKDYAWKKYHVKVSSLYISQIKRKNGLEVGKNYNLPKVKNYRGPNCPPDKERAIWDALKHFGML